MGNQIQQVGFLRLPQILAIIPVCKATWWAGCRTGRFPQPVKLGPRTTAWRAEDIAALVQRLGAPVAGQETAPAVQGGEA